RLSATSILFPYTTLFRSAAKPLCTQNGALLTLTDDVVEIGGKIFVKATATFQHESFTHSVSAFAMHPEERKGMDASQITGASSRSEEHTSELQSRENLVC